MVFFGLAWPCHALSVMHARMHVCVSCTPASLAGWLYGCLRLSKRICVTAYLFLCLANSRFGLGLFISFYFYSQDGWLGHILHTPFRTTSEYPTV